MFHTAAAVHGRNARPQQRRAHGRLGGAVVVEQADLERIDALALESE